MPLLLQLAASWVESKVKRLAFVNESELQLVNGVLCLNHSPSRRGMFLRRNLAAAKDTINDLPVARGIRNLRQRLGFSGHRLRVEVRLGYQALAYSDRRAH